MSSDPDLQALEEEPLHAVGEWPNLDVPRDLTEDDWQQLTDEERADVKAMLADKAWLTRDAFYWKE